MAGPPLGAKGYRGLAAALVAMALADLKLRPDVTERRAAERWLHNRKRSLPWIEAAGLDYDAVLDNLVARGMLTRRSAA